MFLIGEDRRHVVTAQFLLKTNQSDDQRPDKPGRHALHSRPEASMTYDTSSSAVLDCEQPSCRQHRTPAPTKQPDAAAQDTDRQPSRATTKSAKIMIVDDEPINIKVVQKYLQGHGYTNFRTTTDSTCAIEMAESERPDIILLDIMMPEVSGIEILQQARENTALAPRPGRHPDRRGRRP